MAIQISVNVKGLKAFTKRRRKIDKFLKNPLSLDILNKVDSHLVSIALNRKNQIESSGNKERTIKNKKNRSRKGTLRKTYKGDHRPTRSSNVNKYGRDTGTLFTDLFKASLKPGNRNSILDKRINRGGPGGEFSSYVWDYLEDEQPNKIATIMRSNIQKKLGYFLFNKSDRLSIGTLLVNLMNEKVR